MHRERRLHARVEVVLGAQRARLAQIVQAMPAQALLPFVAAGAIDAPADTRLR